MADDKIYLDSEVVKDDPKAPVAKLVKKGKTNGKPYEQEVVGNVTYQFVAAPAQKNRPVTNKKSEPQDKDPWASNRIAAGTAKKEDSAVTTTVGGSLGETKFESKSAATQAATAKKKSERSKAYAASKDPWSNASVKTSAAKPAKKADTAKAEPVKADAAKQQSKGTKAVGAQAAATVAPSKADAAKKAPAAKATNDSVKTKSEGNVNMAKDVKADEKATAKKAPAAKTDAAATQEKVLIEGDSSIPHGKFVIKKTDNGNFVYKLFSSNRRVLATPGGAYKDLSSCKSGIQSVMANAGTAPIEDQTLKNVVEQKCPKWVIYFDNKNEVRLRLLASNGNVVAITNDGYLSKDAAKKGIDAIARAAKGADVVRNDDLW